ncbi:PrsW family glutamic-type intramembrane protease [Enterococcus innesii]|uniref:PrsW family glutamic-type intramembrane protease n=1 Tax=Enterococcus innesii TaxID=2839759 RepID=UPI0022B96065|nr:PrsW family glutamic-type intramembrane protease [Enterococcus innesii]
MVKKILLFFVCISIFFNFNSEIISLSPMLPTQIQLNYFFIGIISVLLSLVPLIIILKKKSQYINSFEISLFFFSGSFIAGSFSYSMVYRLDSLILNAYLIPLIGAIFEELFKLFLVVLLFYIIQPYVANNLLTVFILASFLGLGFQIYEDYIYILNTINLNLIEFVIAMIHRISNSFTSHWMYTGISSIGLFSLFTNRLPKLKSLIWLISPLVLHILWNSSWNNSIIFESILSSSTLLIYLFAYRTVISLD